MFRRFRLAAFAAAMLISGGAFAQSEPAVEAPKKPAIEFERIQSECVRTEALPFGPGERWRACRLTGAGFVGTIGLLDFYYASYCLSARGSRCDRTALMVFANRAYRPEATLEFHRLDPAGTRYSHATMVGAEGSAIAVTARLPEGGREVRQYHAWAESRWTPVDPVQWRIALAAELPRRLPEGVKAVLPAQVMPEPETMTLRVPLRRVRGDAPAGVAEVEVRVEGGSLAVGEVRTPRALR